MRVEFDGQSVPADGFVLIVQSGGEISCTVRGAVDTVSVVGAMERLKLRLLNDEGLSSRPGNA